MCNKGKEKMSGKKTDAAVTSGILIDYYADQLSRYGDTPLGAAWPDGQGQKLRFKTFERIIEGRSGKDEVTVLDLGCGTGSFYSYILENKLNYIKYIGVDVLEDALSFARHKFSDVPFYNIDILSCSENALSSVKSDYVIANGLFTVKRHATDEQMWQFMAEMIAKMWPYVNKGIIFNVMSKNVDWERDDLFHVSYDRMANYLHSLAGRYIGFCADYGLYEYTAYALKP
jgi:SAM-dependent methyltransferase